MGGFPIRLRGSLLFFRDGLSNFVLFGGLSRVFLGGGGGGGGKVSQGGDDNV